MIIVIDGAAGSGKSSTARAVAKKLGIEYIDSGALYRAVTVIFIKSADKKHFLEQLEHTSISFRYVGEQFEVCVEGVDVTAKLRNAEVTENVSSIAAMPSVRSIVNKLMRKTVRKGAYIAEGRDLGSVVFPDAAVKFFLRADAKERAARRFKELSENNDTITFEEVYSRIIARDEKDRERRHDPLTKAPDAVEVDTTKMNFEEQVDKICSIIHSKTNLNYKHKS